MKLIYYIDVHIAYLCSLQIEQDCIRATVSVYVFVAFCTCWAICIPWVVLCTTILAPYDDYVITLHILICIYFPNIIKLTHDRYNQTGVH